MHSICHMAGKTTYIYKQTRPKIYNEQQLIHLVLTGDCHVETSNQCPWMGSVTADCVLSFRVDEKEEKDTKVVPCKWYSEVPR